MLQGFTMQLSYLENAWNALSKVVLCHAFNCYIHAGSTPKAFIVDKLQESNTVIYTIWYYPVCFLYHLCV